MTQRATQDPHDGGASSEAPPSCRWALIADAEGRPGAENMAIDAALLDAVRPGTAFLRLYRWDPPCLSLGRHEPAARRYRRDLIDASGVDVVRRPTGGRAVWHDAEVTYAVAAPTDVFGSLREAYIRIHHMLATALTSLGATVSVAPTRPPMRPDAGACFAAPVGGEIVARGAKLVGSAQYREPQAFLQHGSILLENQQDRVRGLSRAPGAAVPAIALRDLLGRPVGFDEGAAAIGVAARDAWPGEWRADADRPGPPDIDRFQDPAWTWLR
jgi:lipoate-protein ligase A